MKKLLCVLLCAASISAYSAERESSFSAGIGVSYADRGSAAVSARGLSLEAAITSNKCLSVLFDASISDASFDSDDLSGGSGSFLGAGIKYYFNDDTSLILFGGVGESTAEVYVYEWRRALGYKYNRVWDYDVDVDTVSVELALKRRFTSVYDAVSPYLVLSVGYTTIDADAKGTEIFFNPDDVGLDWWRNRVEFSIEDLGLIEYDYDDQLEFTLSPGLTFWLTKNMSVGLQGSVSFYKNSGYVIVDEDRENFSDNETAWSVGGVMTYHMGAKKGAFLFDAKK